MFWILATFTQSSLSLSRKVIDIRIYLFFCGNLNTEGFGRRIVGLTLKRLSGSFVQLELIHQDFLLVAFSLQARTCVLQHLPSQTEVAKQ